MQWWRISRRDAVSLDFAAFYFERFLRRQVYAICAKLDCYAGRRPFRPKTLRYAPKLFGEPATADAAAGGDLHHREAALVGAVGAESEQPVDAGEAGRIGQRLRRKTLRALRARQRGDQRHRVIGQRRRAHRLGAVFGAVAAGEGAKTGRIRRGIETALQRRAREHPRIVPQPGAEQLDVAQIGARRGQRIRRRHDRIAVVGDQQRIGLAERLRHRPRRRRAIGAVFFERDDAPALAADRLLEGGLDHIAIGIVGQQRGERALSDARGVIDDPVDVELRQETQEIDAASGDAGIGRERDHRGAAGARQLRGRRNRELQTAAPE